MNSRTRVAPSSFFDEKENFWSCACFVTYYSNNLIDDLKIKIDPDTVKFNDEEYIGPLPIAVEEGLLQNIEIANSFPLEREN